MAQFLQVFGTGGSPSSFVNVGNNVIALTNMWQKKTITITIPSIIGKTLGTDGVHTSYTVLKFWFDSGSAVNGGLPAFQSGTFDIAQVQLEEGSVATPFEDRPIGLELSLCQRYYEIEQFAMVFYGSANMGWQQSTPHKVYKRIQPTITILNPTGQTNIGTITASSNQNVTTLYGILVGNGNTTVMTIYTASSEL